MSWYIYFLLALFILSFSVPIILHLRGKKLWRVRLAIMFLPVIASICLIFFGIVSWDKNHPHVVNIVGTDRQWEVKFPTKPTRRTIDEKTSIYESWVGESLFYVTVKSIEEHLSTQELFERIQKSTITKALQLTVNTINKDFIDIILKRRESQDVYTHKRIYLFDKTFIDISVESFNSEFDKKFDDFFILRDSN